MGDPDSSLSWTNWSDIAVNSVPIGIECGAFAIEWSQSTEMDKGYSPLDTSAFTSDAANKILFRKSTNDPKQTGDVYLKYRVSYAEYSVV